MTRIDTWREELRHREPGEWPDFLAAHSGLPGPRGNIELAVAVADLASPALIDEWAGSADEYLAFCGTLGLGDRATDPVIVERLRGLARDDRWRVREAVAMALQRLGDAHPEALASLVPAWADDPDPLVRRAAAAGICEPRLLTTPDAAALAIEVCRRATAALLALPAGDRRSPAARTLRQALGYCWSVAIAADPEPGLRVFGSLDTADPDAAWIVKENSAKKRLSRLLSGASR